ncbi:MoaD/ThiS family protein [Nocardioides perillae]|uniref:Molybdopterin converting factor small subunit n=1 Tax=Nocardioides perillae TaxID=1119534 RepID=A0A7Y9RUB1_9ACTN|nr:molybdopterin converting factor small subunit [Nocardioides perillae]
MSQTITLRYWAAAKAAAGTDADEVAVDGPVTLSRLLLEARRLHPEGRLPGVLEVCSVLVEDRPVASDDPAEVLVQPGETVQFLPPFAGG